MTAPYDRSYYEKAYDYIRDDDDYLIRARVAFEKYFADLQPLQDKMVLELGAGLGKNIYFLRQAFAYDTSPYARDFCTKKGIRVVTRLEPETYDVVASIHSLEHVPQPLLYLQQAMATLKKGGLFLLVLPYEHHTLVSSYLPDTNNHFYSWNFRAINNLLYNVGFRVIRNEFLYEGVGYHLFKKLYRRHPIFMYNVTRLLTKLFFRHQRELKIVAIKP